MVIMNTYVDYDFLKKRLKHKFKMDVNKLYDCYKRMLTLSLDEKKKLRELYCRSHEEMDDLADEDSKSRDLFKYVIESPMKLKSAYSEVGKEVYGYAKDYGKFESPTIYAKVGNERLMQEALGEEFNGIRLEEMKGEELLKLHSFEAPYTHFIDCVMSCDYVFFEGDGLKAYQEYAVPHYKSILQCGGICPNSMVPSDHLPVAAVFYYSF